MSEEIRQLARRCVEAMRLRRRQRTALHYGDVRAAAYLARQEMGVMRGAD